MTIEQSIYTRLTTFAPLVALIGTRVFDGDLTAKQDTWPAVSFSGWDIDHIEAGSVPATLRTRRVTVDCYTDKKNLIAGRDALRAVREQVKDALLRWGTNTGDSMAGTQVQDTFYASEFDVLWDDTALLFHCSVDFTLWYEP